MKKIFLYVIAFTLFACSTASTKTEFEQENESIDPELIQDGDVCASEDGCVTILSGVYPGRGAARDYWSIWTITDEKGEKHELQFPTSAYISDVHCLQKIDGTKYYIVDCYSCEGAIGASWRIEAYKIIGDSVKQVNVLDGSNRIKENDFYIDFTPICDFLSFSSGSDWMFQYDYQNRDLYIPITADKSLIDRYVVWHFNGKCFENQGEHPHMRLHKSLSEYNRLVRYATTTDYIIRVDSLDSHELRYASWKRPKTMEDMPDIIIYGGKRNQYDIDDLDRCDDYRFTHDGYFYVVNYCEITPKKEDLDEHHDYLLVKKDNKTIIKQEVIDE